MATFDAYDANYEEVVQQSIAFAGIEHSFFVRAKAAILAELFGDHFGGDRPRLLDVGCGVGRMHSSLKPLVQSLAGCDVSERALERAKGEHPWAEYRPTDDGKIPWDANAFDVSTAVCVFHHVPPKEWATLVADMRRVTRPGGLVVIIEHNPWNPATRLAVARCPFDHDAVLLRSGTASSLLHKARLRHVGTRHFLFVPSEASWAKALEAHLRRIPLGAQYLTVGEV